MPSASRFDDNQIMLLETLQDIAHPPQGSSATLTEVEGAVRITLPPPGLLAYCRPILLGMAFVGLGVGLGLLQIKLRPNDPRRFGQCVICIVLFGQVALYFLLRSIQASLAHTLLEVTPEELAVAIRAPLLCRTWRWGAPKIVNVFVARQRTVTLKGVRGEEGRLLRQLSPQEALWVVSVIHRILRFGPASARPPLPQGSGIVWRKDDETATIVVPPNRRFVPLYFFGLAAVAVLTLVFPARLDKGRRAADLHSLGSLAHVGILGIFRACLQERIADANNRGTLPFAPDSDFTHAL